MNSNDYAALVAMDWGDKEHAIALQTRGGPNEELKLAATAEALHGWLEALDRLLLTQEIGKLLFDLRAPDARRN